MAVCSVPAVCGDCNGRTFTVTPIRAITAYGCYVLGFVYVLSKTVDTRTKSLRVCMHVTQVGTETMVVYGGSDGEAS